MSIIIISLVSAVGAQGGPARLPPLAGRAAGGDVSEEIGRRDNAAEFQEEEPQESRETKIIPLLYAQTSYILEKLNQMKSPDGVVVYNEQDRTLILKDKAAPLEAMSVFVKEVDISLETEALKLEHIRPEDVVKTVEAALTKHAGQVKIDGSSQSIIVTDTPLKIGEIKKLILRLDRVNKKVTVEVRALQIVLNDEHIKGVDWEAIVSDYQQYPFRGLAGRSEENGSASPAGGLSFGTVSQEDYDILLEALDTVGVVHTLSEETVEIENETTADIHVSEEKVIFHLTPNIGRDDRLTVSVEPEFVGAAGDLADTASVEKAVVSVDSGATMVVGSLFKEVKVTSPWKIPLLGDLPLLGFVFRNQGEEMRRAETVTFLKIKTAEK